MNNNEMPDIYRYLDFKKYLEDYRRVMKRRDPGFSHAYICRRLGQENSKSYFANVVTGIKTVTPEFVNRFIEFLGLDAGQGSYFRALVNYNQTYNSKEKEYYLDYLMLHTATENRLISKSEYAYYKGWRHSVVRAMLDIYDFKDDYRALAAAVVPAITASQARASIKLLKSLKLIARDGNGFYKPTQKSVRTDDHVRDDLIIQYQLNCLDIAKTTIMNRPNQPHDVSASILSISEQGLKKIQVRLQRFREEIRALVHNDADKADRVYQLDFLLLPCCKVKSETGQSIRSK